MKTESLASGGARAKARMALRAAPLLLLGVCAPAIRAQALDDSDGDTVPDALEAQLGLAPDDPETTDGRPDWWGVPGHLRYERWEGVAGTRVADLLDSPVFRAGAAVRGFVAQAEQDQGIGDNYGVRLRGTVTAPVAGDYRFHIASDDQSQLWLGTVIAGSPYPASSKFSRRLAARVDGYTGYRAWTATTAQAGPVMTLAQGDTLYIEVLMKESNGLDNLSVGWTRPHIDGLEDTATPEVVPGFVIVEGRKVIVLTSYTPDPLDLDDDGLLDSWEDGAGLNPGDNGSFNPADGGGSDWDKDGLTNHEEWLTGGDPLAAGGNTGLVRRDIWTGITGSTVAALTSNANFPKPANVSRWEQPSALSFGSCGDNYGQRLRCCAVPPWSGKWRFWIASDDASELWVSPTASRLDKARRAYVAGWTNAQAFDTSPAQESEAMDLAAGSPYYLEVLHKEGGGGDHVSVAWAYEPVNWALKANGSAATQSTTYGGLDAERAIDGNTDGTPSADTMAHTNNHQDSWWQVDFGQDRPVNRVVLFNRNDAIQNKERLSNYRISVLDAAGSVLAWQDFHTATGYVMGSEAWDLPQAFNARKVMVRFNGWNLKGNGYLCLAEVQAYDWKTEAVRQVIPASALRSAPGDARDLDGDSLPDAWEAGHGLDAADNGSTNPADGEYGDMDADGVTNLAEYKAGTDPFQAEGASASLQRSVWTNLPGGGVRDLERSDAYLRPPQVLDTAASWPASRGEYYGQRLRGYLTPTQTGGHTFWISGDNECVLSIAPLAAGQSRSHKYDKLAVARVGSGDANFGAQGTWTDQWDRFPSQQSAPVHLVAGKPYYFEVLHKEDWSGDHVEVAWRQPGGAREKMPFAVLRAYTGDAADLDDDDMPDAWESSHGLDAGDNGRLDPAREGAFGDLDGDGLSNRDEYLLGTDPSDADTDNDGLTDAEEAATLGSDPLSAGSGLGGVVAGLAGEEGTVVSGSWSVPPGGGLLGLERRGVVDYPFTLALEGFPVVEVTATPQGNTWAGPPIRLDAVVVTSCGAASGQTRTIPACRFPLAAPGGRRCRALGVLPWLPAGPHTLRLTVLNDSQSRSVRIDSIRILEDSGGWLAARLAGDNTVFPAAGGPVGSAVSPACVEGLAVRPGDGWLSVDGSKADDLHPGPGSKWRAALALPSDGAARPFTVLFEGGKLSGSRQALWTATGIFAADGTTLTVRKGDSLRLSGTPDGSTGGTSSVAVDGVEVAAALPDGEAVAHAFPAAGTFAVTAAHTAADSTLTTATMTVKAVDASFGADLEVRADRWRTWQLPLVPAALALEADPAMRVAEDTPPSGGGRSLQVAVSGDTPARVYARTSAAGPVAATGTVVPYAIGDVYDSGSVEILEAYADGTLRGRMAIVAPALPAGGYVQVSIWSGGAQFADGTTLATLHAADFDANGIATLDVFYPTAHAISSFCHYTRLYDANGTLLSGW